MWDDGSLTIFLVTFVDINVYVSFPSMIGRVQVREFCQKWTWVFGERMKECAISVCDDHLDLRQLIELSNTHERAIQLVV